MENILLSAFESGNAVAILVGALVYLIVYMQRKNTATERNNELKELQDQINDLVRENGLKQKDIEYLMNENSGIKEDIKEIKGTLSQMAISLAEIAAQYKNAKKV